MVPITVRRGAHHWQEYRRTSELKYGIWNLHKFYFRVLTCTSVYYLICHDINGPGISGPGGPFMFDINGPPGPFMLS